MNNGIGNLSGYLAIELWHRHCLLTDGTTNWPRFWSWLAAAATILTAAFATLYRGQSRTSNHPNPSKPS
jgi:hypothetical protein